MDYSTAIKQIRFDALLTQREFAEKIGVSFATVNRWENGHNVPSIKQRRALKKFCERNRIMFPRM